MILASHDHSFRVREELSLAAGMLQKYGVVWSKGKKAVIASPHVVLDQTPSAAAALRCAL